MRRLSLVVLVLVVIAPSAAHATERATLVGPPGGQSLSTMVEARDCFHHVLHMMFILELRTYFIEEHGLVWRFGEGPDALFTQEALPHPDLQEGVLVTVTVPSRGWLIPVVLRLGSTMQPQVNILAEGYEPPTTPLPENPRTLALRITEDQLRAKRRRQAE